MPINIVLEINSSSPADGREGTSDLKNLSEFYQMSWLSTLKFKDVLKKKKKRKHLCGSEETAKKKKDWKKTEGKWRDRWKLFDN